MYIENPFHVGQTVLCINKNFPMVITDSADKSDLGKPADNGPQEGQQYQIDEILGEYIRFDGLDVSDPNHPQYGWRWWKHTHFAPAPTIENELHEFKSLVLESL